MISVIEYKDYHFNSLLEFCKIESFRKEHAAVNMWDVDWELKPNTLLYILSKDNRFSNPLGNFYLLYDDDKVIGCSGIYVSDFSEKIAIAGTRTWLSHGYRTKQYVRDFLLTEQKRWAIRNNISIIALTFNSYNKNLIKLFRKGQKLQTRSKDHLFYNNINYLDYTVMIKGVPQWVIYENLSNYFFNWETLKYDCNKLSEDTSL